MIERLVRELLIMRALHALTDEQLDALANELYQWTQSDDDDHAAFTIISQHLTKGTP